MSLTHVLPLAMVTDAPGCNVIAPGSVTYLRL